MLRRSTPRPFIQQLLTSLARKEVAKVVKQSPHVQRLVKTTAAAENEAAAKVGSLLYAAGRQVAGDLSALKSRFDAALEEEIAKDAAPKAVQDRNRSAGKEKPPAGPGS